MRRVIRLISGISVIRRSVRIIIPFFLGSLTPLRRIGVIRVIRVIRVISVIRRIVRIIIPPL